MPRYQAQIYITLRPSVLDPAGVAVQSGLHSLGFETAEQVRIGKYVELALEADTPELAAKNLDQMCDRLLANTVIENYRFEITELVAA